MISPGTCGLDRDDLLHAPNPGSAFVAGSNPPLCAECNGRISQHPPAPTKLPVQVAPTSKLAMRFLKGANFLHLRFRIFAMAEQCFAYDGVIAYTTTESGAVTADSDLTVELFFKHEDHALKMQNLILDACRSRGINHTDIRIGPDSHVCTTPVLKDDYKPKDTPRRDGWEEVMDAEEHSTGYYTTKLTEEDTSNESVVAVVRFKEEGIKAGWAHVKPKRDCSSAEASDVANRVVLTPELHDLYDGDGSEQGVPWVSMYSTDNLPHEENPAKRVKVGVFVQFKHNACADRYGPQLQNPERVNRKLYKVHLHKQSADRFVCLLNKRHVKTVEGWGGLEEDK